jgi:glycosyltransferase involved in cell wall biosynthesis
MFLFASLTETFGNVTTEAMASGCAVVAFESGAAGELIRSGVNGWLAGPGKEADFIAATRVAALDAAARHAVAEQARMTARRLDWGDITARFESVLEGSIVHAQTSLVMTGLQPAV